MNKLVTNNFDYQIMVNMNEKDFYNQMSTIQNEFMAKVSKGFDNHLKNYVTINLKQLGFEFDSEADFIDFIAKRVTRIGFQNKPNEWELYLDYQTENQKLIGLYNDKATYSYEGSSCSVVFGRQLGKEC